MTRPPMYAMYTFEAAGRTWPSVKEAFEAARGAPVHVVLLETRTRYRVLRP